MYGEVDKSRKEAFLVCFKELC